MLETLGPRLPRILGGGAALLLHAAFGMGLWLNKGTPEVKETAPRALQVRWLAAEPAQATPAPPHPPVPVPEPPKPRVVPVRQHVTPKVKAPALIHVAHPVTPAPAELPQVAPDPAPEPVAAAAPAPTPASSASTNSNQAAADAEPSVAPRFDAAYLSNPAPAYPRLAREMGEQGRVVLRVRVNVGGRPDEVRLFRSSGYERLDHAALEAVSSWRFVPARRGEDTIAAWVLVPIAFNLRN